MKKYNLKVTEEEMDIILSALEVVNSLVADSATKRIDSHEYQYFINFTSHCKQIIQTIKKARGGSNGE